MQWFVQTVPLRLQMWTHSLHVWFWCLLDDWMQELSWKISQSQTNSLLRMTNTAVTLGSVISPPYQSFNSANRLFVWNVNEFNPLQLKVSEHNIPLGGNTAADSHDRGEKNTCVITPSHFTLSSCCPPVSFETCFLPIENKEKNTLLSNEKNQTDSTAKDTKEIERTSQWLIFANNLDLMIFWETFVQQF